MVISNHFMTSREEAHLRLPASVIARKLMAENQREPIAGHLIIKIDLVKVGNWHVRPQKESVLRKEL